MKFGIKKTQIPLIILFVFGALMFFMGFMNHYFFRSFVFDYGNYNFAFWDYAHFRINSIPTYPGNFLQDHYSFLLMYFIPVYWLLNWLTGTYTLIFIQNALILVAAWYTYKLIKLKTENLWLSAGVMGYYFFLLGRYSTFTGDVNLAVMSACFIPVFLYYFEVRKYIFAFIILILSLLSRENIPIWFAFIFIVLIIQHRKERKAVKYSICGIVLSVLYFILLFKVLIPVIETEEKSFTLFNYSALGESPGEAFTFVLRHPVETVKMFFINHIDKPAYDGIKREFYLVYLISGGIVLLLRPQYLIWFIPIVAQKVLNDAPVRWGIYTYYSIEVVTLLPLSVFLVLASLKSKLLQTVLAIAVCIATLGVTLHKMERKNRVIPASFRPEKETVYSSDFYQSYYELRETHNLINKIPLKARVSASEHMFSHLAQRQHIYFFPAVKDAEYIIFSVFDNDFRLPHMENERARNKYLYDSDWEIIGEVFPVFLLKKRVNPGSKLPPLKNVDPLSDTINCDFEIIDSVGNWVLFDKGIVADWSNRLHSDHVRSGNQSLLLQGENRYGKAIQFSDINDIDYITSTVWFYGDANNAHVSAKFSDRLYLLSKSVVEIDESNWKKLEMSFWIPRKGDNKDFYMHVWNSSAEDSLLIDDLQIIRRFR
jgi:hypothetical protein